MVSFLKTAKISTRQTLVKTNSLKLVRFKIFTTTVITCYRIIIVHILTLSSALGFDLPDPLWSINITRYTVGSKYRRQDGLHPEPGPPCLL